ncbi:MULTISPECIES: hypothetical protein [Bacillus]|nr:MULTISPECIES: hypothetical protein [Bacillus]AYY25270.1 hypothetical protein EGX95_01230 [Bacillus sp. FDAARGOS_527]KMP66109.1 hypothetical protein TU61_17665 [Bacillus cereus]KXY02224.1 hypothetical protein AT271_00475 [Bacillus cereus]KXY71811.1 hypothetical protein AT272_13800 [Bacillus cereus]MCC2430483.1 hypothetical protein [Bacillus paranthracis]
MTYDKDSFKVIQKNIQNSKGYISHIDSKTNIRNINSRYREYLTYKQAVYTKYKAFDPIKKKEDATYSYIPLVPKHVDMKKLDNLYQKFGVQDDYINEYEIIHEDQSGNYTAVHIPSPIEYLAYENLLNMDKKLAIVDSESLSNNFVMQNYKRIILLPFVIKNNEKYSEGYVIANIYDVGIITLQVTVTFEDKNVISVPTDTPRSFNIPEVHFYEVKKKYTSIDFWEKSIQRNTNIDEIMSYYVNQLSTLSKVNLQENRIDRRINWVFGDYQINKFNNHEEFINSNERLYYSYLFNGTKEHVKRSLDSEITQTLAEAQIVKSKDNTYMCSPTFSILSFGYTAFHDYAKKVLEKDEKQLKRLKVYNEQIMQIYKNQTLIQMYEYLRFYELSFIKKHFVRNLLNGISNNVYTAPKEYNSLRRDFNFLKLRYNEEILFSLEGTAKKLYKDILEKTNTTPLLKNAEDLFKNIREDVIAQKEFKVKSNETLILILSSILTIVLGYNGIKLMVNDILVKIPYIKWYVNMHPLRTTLGIWCFLILIMTWLNLKRWKMNRK